MKKNKIMRLAGVLLIAVMLSTCIISGTFAKYVTSDNVNDSARVAKFGVIVNGSGSLFAKSYYSAEESEANRPGDTKKDSNPWTELTVETSNDDKLVAPGTMNDEGMTISVIGTPEVDVRVTLGVDEDNLKDVFLASDNNLPDMTTGKDKYFDFDDTEDYHPIVFTLAGTFVENNWKAIKNSSVADDLKLDKSEFTVSGTLENIVSLLTEVFEGDDSDGIYVDANKDLADVIGTFTLTWEWAYEADGGNKKVKLQNQKDTLLGDLAAYNANDDIYYNSDDLIPEAKYEAFKELAADDAAYSLDVSLKLTVNVTQVD